MSDVVATVLVIGHEAHAGRGRLGDLGGVRAVDCRPYLGDGLPDDLSDLDGLVVLGGSMSAWQDEVAPWLPQTRRLLAEAVERSLPTLGICLGAQLLALATGGQVERGALGPEVGPVDIELTGQGVDDALLGPVGSRFGPRFAVPHWHADVITRLPGGAVPLATGNRYPHQAFRLGEAAWGLQYHPEVTVEDWAEWMADYDPGTHPDRPPRETVDAAMAAGEAHWQALAQVHADSFAAVVTAATAAR